MTGVDMPGTVGLVRTGCNDLRTARKDGAEAQPDQMTRHATAFRHARTAIRASKGLLPLGAWMAGTEAHEHARRTSARFCIVTCSFGAFLPEGRLTRHRCDNIRLRKGSPAVSA